MKRRRTGPFLLICLTLTASLLFRPFIAAGSTEDEYLEYDAWLQISTNAVDLGLPHSTFDGTGDYWELAEALVVFFQCRRENQPWEVQLTAGDFYSGNNKIRINRLYWKTRGDRYNRIPGSGRARLAESEDYSGCETDVHLLPLSFLVELQKELTKVPAGEYEAQMSITMFFP